MHLLWEESKMKKGLYSKILIAFLTMSILFTGNSFVSRAEAGRNQYVVNTINNYVNSLNGRFPVSYEGRASGCFAFVNYVWKNVFGVDYYDGKLTKNTTPSKSNDLYRFLCDNGAKTGDIIWAHNPEGVTHNFIIMDYNSSSIEITDGTSSGSVWHNDKTIYLNDSSSFFNSYLNGNCLFTIYKINDEYWKKAIPQNVSKSKITLTPSVNIPQSGMVRIKATVEKNGVTTNDVTWSSDNPNIATINSSGLIKGINVGTTFVTATAEDGVTAKCTVTVVSGLSYTKPYAKEPEIDIENGAFSVKCGYKDFPTNKSFSNLPKFDTKVTYIDTNGKEVEIAGKNHASFSKAHGITADNTPYYDLEYQYIYDISLNNNSRGIYHFTYKLLNPSDNTVLYMYERDIDMGTRVEEVSFVQSDSNLKVGETLATGFTINPTDAYDKSVSYSSSDEDVAVVSDTGVITAKSEGTADIYVTSHDGALFDVLNITVYTEPQKQNDEASDNNSDTQNVEGSEKKNTSINTNPSCVEDIEENIDSKQKKTTLSKPRADKNSITLSWKKVTAKGIKGYEIEYSTDKNFKKDATKKVIIKKVKTAKTTIKKLKTKTKYYVRIRTFSKKNGQKVYSKWSKVKNVKVK
jgi:uncharacterized protein YjdB